MATTRRRTTKAASAATKRTPAKAQATRKAAAAKKGPDVTVYATKAPTDYHKAFARWIVDEVGYNPESASSKKAAFFRGVAIATAARPAFMSSDYLEQWREENGVAKRGPKGSTAATNSRRTTKAAPEPEVDEDDDEFDDDEELEDEESDEFDEESDEEDDSEDDDEFDDEEDDDEFEEEDEVEEEAPPARRTRKAAPAKATARKAAPAKATARTRSTKAKATAADDDDFIF